jgi:hypothetical protein
MIAIRSSAKAGTQQFINNTLVWLDSRLRGNERNFCDG